MSAPALSRLARLLAGEGALPPGAIHEPEDAPAVLGARAGAGPHAAGHEADYELLVEAIREGYLLHYGGSRVLDPGDGDLALLAGDRLYALGLALLADLGDLDAVAELADVISLSAQAHAGGDPDLAEAVWEAAVAAIGWGTSAAHEAAKARARQGHADGAEALRASTPRTRAGTARGR